MFKHLDANAFLRYLLNDIEAQAEAARAVIDSGAAILTNEVLAEIVYVLDKVYGLTRQKIADALEGKGTYGVYLLDTRVKAEDGTTKLAAIKDGKPVAVNALATVAEATAASAAQATTMQLAATAVGGAAVTAQTLVAEPAITGIKVDGAKVTVTVAGMSPIATYQVVTGMTPGKVGTKLDAKSKGDTFEFAKPEGQFFKVIGTRNFK